jgi:magnesium transporter
MLSATFTQAIISNFENALAAQAVLMCFIPMLMGTGGNAGAQASVTIIRGLSLREIEYKNIFLVWAKEISVAFLCGVTLAVVFFGKLMIFDFEREQMMIAIVVCLTLVVTVLLAKTIGCSLPVLTKMLGMDPAVMASPLLTTIVDALSLLVYFSIAQRLLSL